MALFFYRHEKPWRTIAVLFSSQCFPIPRVVVKKSFSTRKTISFIFYSLSVFLFSTVQRCADCNAVRKTRWQLVFFLREESERLFENSESLTRRLHPQTLNPNPT